MNKNSNTYLSCGLSMSALKLAAQTTMYVAFTAHCTLLA